MRIFKIVHLTAKEEFTDTEMRIAAVNSIYHKQYNKVEAKTISSAIRKLSHLIDPDAVFIVLSQNDRIIAKYYAETLKGKINLVPIKEEYSPLHIQYQKKKLALKNKISKI